jgi:hypothetical protein
VVRRKEGDHWISGQAGDPQQTANHCGGRTFIGGLNYELSRLDVSQLASVKLLVGLHHHKHCSFRMNCTSYPGPRLSEECLAAVQLAKLLGTIFTGNKLG